MAGTWPLARAAIVAQLDGLTASGGDTLATETLAAYEWGLGGRQGPSNWPYAFVLPAEQQVNRYPGQMREIVVDVRVRVFLSPASETKMQALQQRYDAWVVALMDAWDDAATLDGAADISVEQSFGGLAAFDDVDKGWGFDMTLGNVRISEVKAFSA